MTAPAEQLRFVTEGAGVFVTTDRVVHVRGDDARTWLNGQITNDVRTLSGDQATYALATTVKGRIVSDLWALAHEDGMAIVLPSARYAEALDILDKHVIMEDVELVPDEGLRVLTVQGPHAAEVAENVSAVRRYEARRLGFLGVDLWVHEGELAGVLRTLEDKAKSLGGGVLDEQGWAHAHVARGVPRIGIDFGEQTYPQEAGLKARALSFQKGCYRGQEVIYMLENRGQLARRLVVLETNEAAVPESIARGSALEVDGKRVGEVTSVDVTRSDTGTTLLMGYLKRPTWDVGQVVVASGVPCTVRSVVGVTDEVCPIASP